MRSSPTESPDEGRVEPNRIPRPSASLVALLAAGGLSVLLYGTVDLSVVAGLVGTTFLAFGLLVGSVVSAVRRVNRSVRKAARTHGAVERLKQQYVDAEFDEREFERRLDHVLDGSGVTRGQHAESVDDAVFSRDDGRVSRTYSRQP